MSASLVLQPNSAAERAFVEAGRAVFAERFPGAAFSFDDPVWDARSLEWLTTSPPKEHNFDTVPTVHHLDAFFHRKYEDRGEGEHHDFHKIATAEELIAEQEANADAHIHMPSPSYWPLLLALGLPVMAYGVIFSRCISR